MPEKLNLKIEMPGNKELTEREEALRRTTILRPQTIRGMMNLIDSMELGTDVTAELKKMAAKYPNDALPHFRRNIQTHISKIRTKLRPKSQYDDVHEMSYTPSEPVGTSRKPSGKYHANQENRKKHIEGVEEYLPKRAAKPVETLDRSEFAYFREQGF